MDSLLKEGDVINLKKGMKVYAEIPEMFVYSNKKTSRKLTTHDVTVFELYSNDTKITEDINSVSKSIVDDFDSKLGFKLSVKDAKEFVLSKVKKPKSESFVLNGGEFVVIRTTSDGGGTGMGAHDVYPNGHRVYCKRLRNGDFDENGTEVNFYQTGSFTAMITKIKPIRKMKPKFV